MKNLIKIITVISLVLAIGLPASAADVATRTSDLITKGPWVDVRAFANLSAAKASPSTNGKTILITNAQTVNTLTISNTRSLRFERGGQISVNSGKTLTISGHFEAGLSQVFAGSGTVVFGGGKATTAKVRPEWFTADVNTPNNAINLAITAANGQIPVELLSRVYHIGTNTININKDGTQIIGIARPRTGWDGISTKNTWISNMDCPVIQYTGTGVGTYAVNVTPAIASGYIWNVKIKNVRLEVEPGTAIALRINQPGNSLFEDIAVYGNSGANIGIVNYGSINTEYNRIDVTGSAYVPNTTTGYLQTLFSNDLGRYSNWPTTTTYLNNSYLHYSYGTALYNNSFLSLNNTILEANYSIGFQNNDTLICNECWGEGNTLLGYLSGSSFTTINNSHFDTYTNQYMFTPVGGFYLSLNDSYLSSSHAAPCLMDTSSLTGTEAAKVYLDRVRFNKTWTLFPVASANILGADKIFLPAFTIKSYEFFKKTAAANATVDPVDIATGLASKSYRISQKSTLATVAVDYTGTITAGSYEMRIKINGSVITGDPAGGLKTAAHAIYNYAPFVVSLVPGDTVTVYLSTSADFAATGGDFSLRADFLQGNFMMP